MTIAEPDIQRALSRRLHDRIELGRYDLRLLRVYRAKHSDVFEYQSRVKHGPTILVKWRQGFKPSGAHLELPAREFGALSELWDRSGPALRGTIPRPIALFEDLGAFVTEKLPGKSLQHILRRDANLLAGPFRQGRLRRTAFLTGQWARLFHESTQAPPMRYDSDAFMSEVSSWLLKCTNGGMSPQTADEIIERCLTVSTFAADVPNPTASAHGDFLPMNVLIDHDCVSVIDFEDWRPLESTYADLGMMNAYLILISALPLASTQTVAVVRTAFLAGYGDVEDQRLLGLYTLRAALSITECQFRCAVPKRGARRQADLERLLLGLARGLTFDDPRSEQLLGDRRRWI